jgi:hypothetical protein
MSIQPPHKPQPGAQINRTPAPKLTTRTGGQDYGEANSSAPSSLPPGVGGPQSILGQNMRDSVDDPVLAEVMAKGIAGRGDSIPADNKDQLRQVSAEMLAPTHGAVRQQDPNFFAKKSNLPASLSDSEAEPIRKP